MLQSVADEARNANRGAPLALAVVVAIGARTTKGRLIRSLVGRENQGKTMGKSMRNGELS